MKNKSFKMLVFSVLLPFFLAGTSVAVEEAEEEIPIQFRKQVVVQDSPYEKFKKQHPRATEQEIGVMWQLHQQYPGFSKKKLRYLSRQPKEAKKYLKK